VSDRKPANLRVRWSKRERDLTFAWEQHAPDGHLMHNAFNVVPVHGGRSLTEELEARGYDLTTLRFQIRRKGQP
jgi:hypothetical protein